MKVSDARRVALDVVTRVREREAYAHETLDAALRRARLEPRDAALATRLAYGAIASRGTLEEAVMRGLDAGTRIEDRVMDALIIGAYELLFASTAAHAAVSETVELARTVQPRAAGLANAAMRRLSTSASQFPWGDPTVDTEALARMHGHPLWLTELAIADLGREAAEEMLSADNEPAPFFLASLPHRLDTSALSSALLDEGVKPADCPLAGCIRALEPSLARTSAVVRNRQALVMDAGAQLAAQVADVEGAKTLVEIGAGRGSKSLLIASRAAARGDELRLVAVDVHAFKLEALAKTAQELGLSSIEPVVADATDADADLGVAQGGADVVLIDAPCSGLGTLRRHPDRRWRAKPAEIAALAGLGNALLKRAAHLVMPGGFVVYSTCTFTRRENEDVIEGFLDSDAGSEFESVSLADLVPQEWSRFMVPEGWFRSHPTPDGPDGHFVARLRRRR